jgi:hypothetical protein
MIFGRILSCGLPKLSQIWRHCKWMRIRTYERIWARIDEIEEGKDIVCMAGIAQLLRRSGLTIAGL